MRAADAMQKSLFTVAPPDDFVREDHALRRIQSLVNEALTEMNARFDQSHAPGDEGRNAQADLKDRPRINDTLTSATDPNPRIHHQPNYAQWCGPSRAVNVAENRSRAGMLGRCLAEALCKPSARVSPSENTTPRLEWRTSERSSS